jgi:uncharacterized membrane protein
MQELVLIGFTDKHRAVEVLAQLQRLQFDWSADMKDAVAVEIEKDGLLRLHHSELLDPAFSSTISQWKAILSSIVPLPHAPHSSANETLIEVRNINAQGLNWLKLASLDDDFIREAAAVLRPGNSAILAIVRESKHALEVLSGYSYIVLHTSINHPKAEYLKAPQFRFE